ncbi:ABZJ_00895 family protein [Parasulfitobacter algicola]|uniref:Transmembrane protein n=1 Tax=Parasulfitobacter algicola TaxID=2614809 RepID=A0ABX2ITM5_9RHOB|nr:ABZJ_00895 family protein [Sulfitobacter algicola]NSX56267.1 hypothetical protein [Sulfitobacter algicola]
MDHLFGLVLRYLLVFTMTAASAWFVLQGRSAGDILHMGALVMAATAALPGVYTGGYFARRAGCVPKRLEAFWVCFIMVSVSLFLLFPVLLSVGALDVLAMPSAGGLLMMGAVLLCAYVGLTWMFFRMGAWGYLKLIRK